MSSCSDNCSELVPVDQQAELVQMQMLAERYKHILDLSDADRARYVNLAKSMEVALEADNPVTLKSIISRHIQDNPNRIFRMKIPSLPLPLKEELMIRHVMDSCPFKATLSCCAGMCAANMHVNNTALNRFCVGWCFWSFLC